MKRCAFLSTDNLENFFVYDRMLIEPLKQCGWLVEEVSWHQQNVDWNNYDVVIVRSTWDYQNDADGFMRCLEKIECSSARLENSLKLIQWNIRKDYLKDMQQQGITIVPTLWHQHFDLVAVQGAFAEFNTDEIVIKPLVSANADDTYRLSIDSLSTKSTELTEIFKTKDFMIQPFIKAIIEEGEYSLFFFAGHYSHSILKMPKQGDFRVQEEHGGKLQCIQPCETMLTSARHAMASLPDEAFYARVDLVRHEGEFAVMEVELIEPSLYFNMDPQSINCFTQAFVETFGSGSD